MVTRAITTLFVALFSAVIFCSVSRASVVAIDMSDTPVAGTIPFTIQFKPDVAWWTLWLDGYYLADGPSSGTYNWKSTSVPNGKHEIQLWGVRSNGTVSDEDDILLNVANGSSPPNVTQKLTVGP